MAMGIEQRWKGVVQKAKQFWSDLTEDEAGRTRGDNIRNAVHQSYGVENQGGLGGPSPQQYSAEAREAKRGRGQNSMDEGPSDAYLSNPAARAGRDQFGGTRRDNQQMQQRGSSGQMQQNRTPGNEYSAPGGSGITDSTQQEMQARQARRGANAQEGMNPDAGLTDEQRRAAEVRRQRNL